MECPRCHVALTVENEHGIEVDRCPQCNGRWLDHDELDQLEALSAPQEDARRGMIEYAKRESELHCPVCQKTMVAFNYRANPLELDTCEDLHGWWLDAGEDGRVRDLIQERVQGLARAANAEESWGNFLHNVGHQSVWDRIGGLFKGGRR